MASITPRAAPAPWLVNAPVDLVIGAGLSALVVIGLALGAGRANPGLSGLLLSSLCALVLVPHLGASLLRAWRGRARVPALVLTVAALVAAPLVVVSGASALEALWTVAACVLPAHVALQVCRVVAIVARRSAATGTPMASSTGAFAAGALAVAGVVSALAGPRAPLIVRGFLSVDRGIVVAAALAIVAVVLALVAARKGGARGLAFAAVAYGVAGAGWVVPLVASGAADPQASASNAFAIAHGLQLLWLVFFLEPRIAAQKPPVGARTFDPLAHFGLALIVGALLVVDLPWIASRAAGIDVATALLATQGTFALAHAVIDALAFRLSDPEIARAAFEPTAPAPHGRASVSNVRAALVLVPGALIASGLVVDLAQTWSVRASASERDLQRAETLHPYDARALLPQAQRALANDDVDGARILLGDIAISRSFSPGAARARFLLCAYGAEAASTTEPAGKRCLDVPAFLADDIDVLTVGSHVALEEEHVAVAKQKAARAVSLAPDEPAALASLGIVEASLKELTAKERLLRALALQEKRTGKDPLTSDPGFLEAGVALAEAHRTRNERDKALAVVERVLEGATAADRPRDAMRALAVRARTLDEVDPRGALDAYQRALRIAPFAQAPAEEASLWLDYGALLARSAATPAARYAAVAKAFALVEALPAQHHDKKHLEVATTTRRQEIELLTDDDVLQQVRADIEGAALKALALTYDEAAP